VFGEFIDPQSGSTIDRGLAVFFAGPNSYTGEDVAELQFHGSPLIAQRILGSLFALGITPAEPGEFTKRAFLNSKLDLVQAEAVADLIAATSERALSVAAEQLNGRLSAALHAVGEPLRDAVAELEAGIDFSDEDITPASLNAVGEELKKAHREIGRLLGSYSFGQVVRDGFRVLLSGRPNVGKSSLLNLLVGRERAIVTPISGTTRDLIEEEVTLKGYRFIVCDSAGITDSSDTVERIGIERARERIGWADLVLFVVDADDRSESWKEVLESLRGKANAVWMITNKIDLNPGAFSTHHCDSTVCTRNFFLSASTKAGFDDLTAALVSEVESRLISHAETSSIVTNARQCSGLLRAEEALQRASGALDSRAPAEIVAAETRLALSELKEIVGETYTEDILGRIFSRFCIGK
jgi:tRNA modification GTPase